MMSTLLKKIYFLGLSFCLMGGAQAADETQLKEAVFAGGCFWCVEKDFEQVDGVHEAISGFAGGAEENPTYSQVASGRTTHTEAVKVIYDPAKVSYNDLLEYFWRQINPTDAGGQFVDRGPQYRTTIFYSDDSERQLAEASKQALAESGRYDDEIVTPIEPLAVFYTAEDGHQDYYKEHAYRYKTYRYHSGRDQYLQKVWGDDLLYQHETPKQDAPKVETQAPVSEVSEQSTRTKGWDMTTFKKPGKDELKQQLSEVQYYVTQEDGTERPFENKYHDEKREGIYVDIVSGEPLFSSIDKYDSGTGWPSFSRPLVEDHIVTKKDYKLIWPRTEVRSKYADSHLGHVFDDGPAPTGLRYCMNSASLRFIPKDSLESEGYGEFLPLFSDA